MQGNLGNLFDAIKEMRTIYPAWPSQRLHILLAVALDPGCRMDEIQAKIGLSQAAISRNIQELEQEDGMVKTVNDPDDWRCLLTYPTKKGKQFLDNFCTTALPR
ncbi:MAG: hypothetical protein FD119_2823 [Stygiobacter sp.]|nr:MAG: hypothetical protein FD119_2823 [Stygiobacter sp.]